MTSIKSSPEIRAHATPVTLDGRAVEVAFLEHPAPAETILLLHEALGSVGYWKDFPLRLAHATAANVLVYSRAGQGNSDGPLSHRDRHAYQHEVGNVIPALLAHFGVQQPILYGHSEGAGLALMYAAHSQNVKALILESPFVGPAKQSGEHIRSLAQNYSGSRMQQRLAQYHRDADQVFAAWIESIARSADGPAAFADALHHVHCPVLALQGQDDEFGTTPHSEAMLAVLPTIEFEVLPATGHLPHRQSTQAVLDRVSRFLNHQPALTPHSAAVASIASN